MRAAALTLPVFILAMAHLVPALAAQSWADSPISRWFQFALTTPVVAWAGWPFFRRGWRSLITGHLNMFTLIAIGVGAAYVYSAVAMFAPGIFPHAMQHGGKVGIYFEAAAVIIPATNHLLAEGLLQTIKKALKSKVKNNDSP